MSREEVGYALVIGWLLVVLFLAWFLPAGGAA